MVFSCSGIQFASPGSVVARVLGAKLVVGMARADFVKSSAAVAVKAACAQSRNWLTDVGGVVRSLVKLKEAWCCQILGCCYFWGDEVRFALL
jgi:hypothetical protein